jgi:hypothetical protein
MVSRDGQKNKENEIKSVSPVADTRRRREGMFGDCVVAKGTLAGAALKG